MRFGICAGTNAGKIKKINSAGAEYIELNAMEIAAMTDEEYDALKARHDSGEFNTYSCNGLCPADLRLTGDVDFEKVKAYAKKTFSRLAGIGVTMLVFGSGKAKRVPDGFPMEKAWEQLYEVGRIFAEEAEKHGQTIAVEGLRREEVNIVNTLHDVHRYVVGVGRPNFGMHADFYHMNENDEPLTELDEYKSELVHVHICGRNRGMPPEEDNEFIRSGIGKLKEIGYAGNVSFEGALSDSEDEIRDMLRFFASI